MQRGTLILVSVLVVALGVACFAAGLSLGSLTARADAEKIIDAERERVRQLEMELSTRQQELDSALREEGRLEVLLGETRRQLEDAEQRALSLQTALSNELENLRRSNDELAREKSSLENSFRRIQAQVSVVSQAIPILNQLRAVDQLPPDRNATLDYWLDVKSLVASFDPALTPSVDRVINNIDGLMDYYEWIERYPGDSATAEQLLLWFESLPQSYQLYVNAVNQLIDEILTSIASKLSALRDSLG
ncbi:MAG: hypothetical protein QXY54_06935 [Nitrososphaerota archaeon]